MAAAFSAWATTPSRGFTSPLSDAPDTHLSASPTLRTGRVVALTDFSASATNAAWRAALVARDLGLPLHIVGLPPAGLDRRKTQLLLDELTGELRGLLRIAAQACLLPGRGLSKLADAAGGAALLVVDATHGSRLRKWLFGSLAQRLARRCGVPVLAVRRPAVASYRRVTVCVDPESAASGPMAAARSLSRDNRMQVLHVTMFGHVATAVLDQGRLSPAQLVVLGHPPRDTLMDLLLGGVASRLVPATHADVLLVPLPRRSEASRANVVCGARPS